MGNFSSPISRATISNNFQTLKIFFTKQKKHEHVALTTGRDHSLRIVTTWYGRLWVHIQESLNFITQAQTKKEELLATIYQQSQEKLSQNPLNKEEKEIIQKLPQLIKTKKISLALKSNLPETNTPREELPSPPPSSCEEIVSNINTLSQENTWPASKFQDETRCEGPPPFIFEEKKEIPQKEEEDVNPFPPENPPSPKGESFFFPSSPIEPNLSPAPPTSPPSNVKEEKTPQMENNKKKHRSLPRRKVSGKERMQLLNKKITQLDQSERAKATRYQSESLNSASEQLQSQNGDKTTDGDVPKELYNPGTPGRVDDAKKADNETLSNEKQPDLPQGRPPPSSGNGFRMDQTTLNTRRKTLNRVKKSVSFADHKTETVPNEANNNGFSPSDPVKIETESPRLIDPNKENFDDGKKGVLSDHKIAPQDNQTVNQQGKDDKPSDSTKKGWLSKARKLPGILPFSKSKRQKPEQKNT